MTKYYTKEENEKIKQKFCIKALDKRPYRTFDFYKNKRILLWTRKPGLGDMVMNAIACDILREKYGLDVWYGCRENPSDREFPLVVKNIPSYVYKPDLKLFPLEDNFYPRGYHEGRDHQGEKHPFDCIIDFRYNIHALQNTIFQCIKEFGIDKIETNFDGFRVKENLLTKPDKTYDIVMCCSTGGWKPIRAYRKNQELKQLLEQKGYSVLDLTTDGKAIKQKYGIIGLLTYVKWAKYYIGTETGPTHLVSGVHNNAIIIQAGIHHSAFWNCYKNTTSIDLKLKCGGRQCQARQHEQCPKEICCIDQIEPEYITSLIK